MHIRNTHKKFQGSYAYNTFVDIIEADVLEMFGHMLPLELVILVQFFSSQ